MKHWTAGPPLISCCWPGMAHARSPWITNRPLGIKGAGNWPRRCQNCPGYATGSRGPSACRGLPRSTSPPRTALDQEGNGKRWNSQTLGVPALHREAECDTTGNYWPSAFRTYEEWAIGARVCCLLVFVVVFCVFVFLVRFFLLFF